MAAYAFDFEFSGYEGLTVSITFDIAEGEFNAQGWDDRAEFGFHAESWWGGQFSGHLWAGDAGHGMIDSGVQAVSAGPAWFSFWGTQDLFGYTDNRVWAMAYSGASEEAYMNLLFNNSMYVVGLGQADHHGPFLAAAGDEYGIGYAMQIQDPTGDASAGGTANIYGSGDRKHIRQWDGPPGHQPLVPGNGGLLRLGRSRQHLQPHLVQLLHAIQHRLRRGLGRI